jgi:hypothetical protein
MNKTEVRKMKKALREMVWECYNGNEGWGEIFFGGTLTLQEVEDAVEVYVKKCLEIYGEFGTEMGDRYRVRDLILYKRGKDVKTLEMETWIRVEIEGEDMGVVEVMEVCKREFMWEETDSIKRKGEYLDKEELENKWLRKWNDICEKGRLDDWFYRLNNKSYNHGI